ncbi:MAG: putative porin [Candidatus Omnitrophota bacterium]
MLFFKRCFVAALSVGVILTSTPSLYADETSEVILKLLIKKGIVTQEEIDEIKKEVAKEGPVAPKGLEERVTKLEKDSPSWLRNFELKGDLRLRNDHEMSEPGKDDNQQRLRFRVGATTEVNDKIALGFGLATGDSAATSTNQTMDDSFTSKEIDLDYAYAKYKPYSWMYLIGGKFTSPFFHTDMLWDSDVTFEGFAGELSHKLDLDEYPTKVSLRGGYFPLEDTVGPRDIVLSVYQAGTSTDFGDSGIELKTGIAYYNFHSIEGAATATLTGERTTNTYIGTSLAEDYRVISPTVKLSLGKIGGLLGEYAENTALSTANEAWRLGAWLGKAKVKKKGQWRLLGQYSEIEADSFVDIFPDGDFNDAGTNAKGWEAILDYGISDNVVLILDYYNTEVITGAQSDDQKIQADVIFKF